LEATDGTFAGGSVGLGAIPSVGKFDDGLVGAYKHFVVKAPGT
jgi:hypothetical protein